MIQDIISFSKFFFTFALTLFLTLSTQAIFGYKYGQAQIGKVKVKIEICVTDEEKELGLGGRTELDDNYAMVFIFDESYPGEHLFWMKGMLIPIDIIWLMDGIIVHIEENVPPPFSILTKNLPTYGHNVISDMVFEFKAGFVDKHLITIGQAVNML